jgi:PAS domain S-box-containing protein/putative nucleotidyltransferase with HDIG domain
MPDTPPKIPPIARDKVFEAMIEPIVILDEQNMVVDINSAMLDLMGETASNVIGKPAKEVFEGFPIPIKQYTQTSHARAEAIFEIGGKEIHYEMTVWPMYDAQKNMTGRIFISHDITALKEIEKDLHKLNTELEDRVHARTRELEEAYDVTLEGWARTLELHDKETENHTQRVTDLTLKIARRMKFTDNDLEDVRRGAILHDIGKMGIPDKILLKPGALTPKERAIMEEHPVMAYTLLSPIPFLKKALDIPYCHHEKWDGTGYPRGLKEEEIPLAARIFAVADVWDAILSDRPYKKSWARKEAIAYFIEQAGTHFDPKVVNVFLDMLEKGEI